MLKFIKPKYRVKGYLNLYGELRYQIEKKTFLVWTIDTMGFHTYEAALYYMNKLEGDY